MMANLCQGDIATPQVSVSFLWGGNASHFALRGGAPSAPHDVIRAEGVSFLERAKVYFLSGVADNRVLGALSFRCNTEEASPAAPGQALDLCFSELCNKPPLICADSHNQVPTGSQNLLSRDSFENVTSKAHAAID
jgi:hypothetical protein